MTTTTTTVITTIVFAIGGRKTATPEPHKRARRTKALPNNGRPGTPSALDIHGKHAQRPWGTKCQTQLETPRTPTRRQQQ